MRQRESEAPTCLGRAALARCLSRLRAGRRLDDSSAAARQSPLPL